MKMFFKKINFILVLLFFKSSLLLGLEPPIDLIIKNIKTNDTLSDKVLIRKNDRITVNYRGWIFDNSVDVESLCDAKGKLFDSTLDKGFREEPGKNPFTFVIGQGLVIKGWELGFNNMQKGDIRCLVIPPHLGYGRRNLGIIRPNSTLIFEIHLVEVEKD